MSWWERHQINKKVRKEERFISDAEKKAKLLGEANDKLADISGRRGEAEQKVKVEERYQKQLDRNKLEDEITSAKSKLYIQRQKLIRRLIHFNNEYSFISTQPDSPKKQKELERCSAGSKNAAYALAVIEQAIDRLDDLPSEYEWREIMRDLTKGYKLVNKISVGSDLVTRLAFLWQQAKYDIKDDISVNAMEHYYGRSIDTLLEEQKIDKVAAEMLVKDEALKMDNEKDIMNAIRWGTIFTIQPSELADAAQEQSINARRNHQQAIYDDPEEVYERPMDLDAALDNLPSMM